MPAKKNAQKSTREGRRYTPAETKALIDSAVLQMRFAWKRPPVEHPEIEVKFFTEWQGIDHDGIFTTLMDVLQSAGVIRNDNIAHCNGKKTILPSEVDTANPRALVTLSWLE